jgi:hypothetical protein
MSLKVEEGCMGEPLMAVLTNVPSCAGNAACIVTYTCERFVVGASTGYCLLCLNPSCVLGVVFTHHGSCRQEPVVASLLFGVIGQYSMYAAWALLTLEAYR